MHLSNSEIYLKFMFELRNMLKVDFQNWYIPNLSWNLAPRLIQTWIIQWWCSLSLVSTRNPSLGKFGPKNKNCQFKLKFSIFTNSNEQDSMVVFAFSAFNQKYLLWANLIYKIKLSSFNWNLVAKLIWICKTQWRCSIFLF